MFATKAGANVLIFFQIQTYLNFFLKNIVKNVKILIITIISKQQMF
jgi:hypothetical protein